MILCFSQDDMKVVEAAYQQHQLDFNTFGIAYCYLCGHSLRGFLRQNEDLYITAHGNAHEIGNEGAGLSLSPNQLAATLCAEVLPGRYTGRIFVSACNSAPQYIHALLAAFGPGYAHRIFGCQGGVPMAILLPNNINWQQAA